MRTAADVKQVDLYALDLVRELLARSNQPNNAAVVEAALAELRALRELVGMATGFQIGPCHVYAADSMNPNGKWAVEDDSDENQTEYFADRDKALAAAREWEADNA